MYGPEFGERAKTTLFARLMSWLRALTPPKAPQAAFGHDKRAKTTLFARV